MRQQIITRMEKYLSKSLVTLTKIMVNNKSLF
jgi:hypothetical protein